jgi:hypothetical protein
MFPLSSGWSPHLYNFYVDRITHSESYSYRDTTHTTLPSFNIRVTVTDMVQILPVVFVLAAAANAIAPVAALPVTLKNGSVSYDLIDDYFLLTVYRSAELNARDESEIFGRNFLQHNVIKSFFWRQFASQCRLDPEKHKVSSNCYY